MKIMIKSIIFNLNYKIYILKAKGLGVSHDSKTYTTFSSLNNKQCNKLVKDIPGSCKMVSKENKAKNLQPDNKSLTPS